MDEGRRTVYGVFTVCGYFVGYGFFFVLPSLSRPLAVRPVIAVFVFWASGPQGGR